MEATGAVGLGPGTKGALEGLDIIGTCASDLSTNLAVEVFWISVLDTAGTSDAEVKGEDGSLSVCWEPVIDVFLT